MNVSVIEVVVLNVTAVKTGAKGTFTGVGAGVTAEDAEESTELPILFVATTVNV